MVRGKTANRPDKFGLTSGKEPFQREYSRGGRKDKKIYQEGYEVYFALSDLTNLCARWI